MTDGATMPAFSDERLIDAAGAVVADRPEQRPLLVVAVASRLEVVVDAPPYPSHGAFCRSRALDRSIKLYRLWLKRRSPCLSPSLGAYGLQDAPPRSGQPPPLARATGARHFPDCPRLRGRSHRCGSWETVRG